jgi:hypothetical protein
MDVRSSWAVAACLLIGACASNPSSPELDSPVSVQPASESKTAVETAEASGGNDMVCAREQKTGTRLGRSVCRTREQIERERSMAQDDISRQRTIVNTAPAGN